MYRLDKQPFLKLVLIHFVLYLIYVKREDNGNMNIWIYGHNYVCLVGGEQECIRRCYQSKNCIIFTYEKAEKLCIHIHIEVNNVYTVC